MKSKLHLFFIALLFSVGVHAQSVTVTSTLQAGIETGDALNFIANYDTNGVTPSRLLVHLYEANGTTRYGADQGFKSLGTVSGTETVSINAPLVAGNYVARVFIENPTGYAKTYATNIPFTVTTKVITVKATYSFDTAGAPEGWVIGSTGGAGATATVSGGSLTINKGTQSWGTTYVQQKTYKLDPTIHSYVHITFKKSAWSDNNEFGLDWIKTGTTRSSSTGANITISTNADPNFTTVTYNLGANAEWAGADATDFRIYYRKNASDTKGSGDLLIDSIVFNNSPAPTLNTPNFDVSLTNLAVYPNPFTDTVSYNLDTNDSDAVNVELIGIDGKTIKSISGNNSGTINTGDLNKGVYFLRASSGNVQETKKLIKN